MEGQVFKNNRTNALLFMLSTPHYLFFINDIYKFFFKIIRIFVNLNLKIKFKMFIGLNNCISFFIYSVIIKRKFRDINY